MEGCNPKVPIKNHLRAPRVMSPKPNKMIRLMRPPMLNGLLMFIKNVESTNVVITKYRKSPNITKPN